MTSPIIPTLIARAFLSGLRAIADLNKAQLALAILTGKLGDTAK